MKGNLLKHQKVSKYYKSGCLKILLFMSLLTAPIVKKGYLGSNLIDLSKKFPKTNLEVF